jgi:anti-sigma B factor antagonist
VVKTGVDLLSTSVTTYNAGGETYVIVELSGEADATNSDALREILDAEIRRQPRTMVLNLRELRFMDSTALHVILRASRTLDRNGCILAIAAPCEAVAKVLKLTATDQLIPVYANVSDATA